jgi:3-hydroxyisobutyrate dehydrogenase-like beta-hydroxyacid dehydrogenase
MTHNLGFVGLGNMGTPMVRRLLAAGHRVTVTDVRPEMAEALAAIGATAVADAAAVADQAETVLVSLPMPKIVEAVAAAVVGGKTIRRFVDLSTTGSSTSQRIAAKLGEAGIVHIDSPVSGGVAGAVNGTLAVMVSGPKAEFEAIRDVLAVIGKLFFIGETTGVAQTMKLANNLLSATALAATSEAVVMGVKAGIDPAVMIDVINAGSGRNSASQDKFPRSILPRTFDFGFATGLLYKDLKLCMEEAEALGTQMWVGTAVKQLYQLCNTIYGPQSDFTEIVKVPETWAGVEVGSKKTDG